MPEDVGGSPFPNGWEPDDDRGGADEEFASVVFDEDFVRSATIHEPTAVERLLAAAEARAAEASEAEGRGLRARGGHPDDEPPEGFFAEGPHGLGAHEFDDGLYDPDVLDDDYGHPRGYRARWHRTVAWLLALVMGIGMVALAFTAVYRGASGGGRQDQVPAPASTKVGTDNGPPRMGPASHAPPATASAPAGGH